MNILKTITLPPFKLIAYLTVLIVFTLPLAGIVLANIFIVENVFAFIQSDYAFYIKSIITLSFISVMFHCIYKTGILSKYTGLLYEVNYKIKHFLE